MRIDEESPTTESQSTTEDKTEAEPPETTLPTEEPPDSTSTQEPTDTTTELPICDEGADGGKIFLGLMFGALLIFNIGYFGRLFYLNRVARNGTRLTLM